MNRGAANEVALLRRLARLHNVQTAYLGMDNQRIQAPPESLRAVLQGLDALAAGDSLNQALQRRQRELWHWRLEPVIVAWEGALGEVELRLPAADAHGPIEVTIELEEGSRRSWQGELSRLTVLQQRKLGTQAYVALSLPLVQALPLGYARLRLEAHGQVLESLLIAAPERCYAPVERDEWGVFLPLYALRSERSWGAGDLTDLSGLLEWASRQGASFVGTLPLLACFLDMPFEPSPYAPVSRLLWNELFIDPARPIPGADHGSRRSLGHMPPPPEAKRLDQAGLVDYAAAMALKRRVLEQQARDYDGAELDAFLEQRPVVAGYARFRAATERQQGRGWSAWPERQRRGGLQPGDYDADTAHYYAFAQWRLDTQMRGLAAEADNKGVSLYLDLPVGVHPHGYDAWRYQHLFAGNASVGAPPDIVTTSGQDWGFQPLAPEAVRRDGYAYVIDYLRHHMRAGGMLRVDHVMGLHRLYWVPRGGSPHEGVYVGYPAEEMYAILALESQRNRCVVIGENLGIVTPGMNQGLARHAVGRMYVQEIELRPDPARPFAEPEPDVVASFGTHDLPSFAAFWQGADIEQRVELGVLDADREPGERLHREQQKQALLSYLKQQELIDGEADASQVYRACVSLLASSPARRVLINLEDAWLEALPQNVPGTTSGEQPNWRRRARHSLEELDELPALLDIVALLRERRPAGKETP